MSFSSLCELFGYTRQGYWKQRREHYREEIDTTALLNEVRDIRGDMPRCGVRKLQVILEEAGHRIGRDRLFELLRAEGMLVARRHTRIVTTYSRHWMKKYANLIKGMKIVHPNQVWVSDITYVDIYENGVRSFAYLSLITDAYTHEIVGWALHDTLDTEGPLRALKMAGTAAQTAPARMLVTVMHRRMAQLGSLPGSRIMQAAAARPPISACPSPPRFQQRMRKAGVTASATHSSIAMFCSSTQNLRVVPKEPFQIAP